jgi:glycosyltransferase involved in cell wall biosynthesis
MRLTIDATPLLLRSAGVKTYVYHWTRSLAAAAAGRTLDLFPYLDAALDRNGCPHERSILGPAATLARLAALHAANASPLPILNAALARRDVFHASHQLLRPPRNARLTATVYDMTCWIAPETHTPDNVSMAKRFAAAVLTRADGLIAISESTRNDAARLLGVDPSRIEVIYPGVSDAYFGAAPKASAKPYILFVGTIEPRKNVGALLDAYQALPDELRRAFDLVIAGSPGWGGPAVLHRLRSGIEGVRYLGYVPEAELPGLTAGASVFVYPSLYEGFGLPLAQAMAAGVASVTSKVSSLPEVAGEAALLVDPHSAAELSRAIETLLRSGDLRRELGAAGRRRAGQYRWEFCARRSWEFFERLL